MNKNRRNAYLALTATAVIWGFGLPIIKYSLQFCSPATFLFYRFLLASIIVVLPLAYRLKQSRFSSAQLTKMLLYGLLGTPITLYLLFTGLAKTSAVDGSLIWVLSPAFISVAGWSLLKEKITPNEKIGMLLAFTGVIATTIQPLFENSASPGSLFGNLLVLAGTLCWAAFSFLNKKEGRWLDPFTLTTISFIVAVICFFPLQLTAGFALDTRALPGIIYMGIFGSVVAYLTYTYGISQIEVSEAAVFTYLQPIFAVPTAILLLGESITPFFIIGALLIGLGVYKAQMKTTV